MNAWFCTNANHICFSKCLLSLLLLKESQDGATLESAHFELQDDKYLVNVHFYTAKPSLSHGDLVFDPRSDLSQGRGDDAEHPTVIPMDLPSSHQEPRGPMTRARARALENEVTSFLSDTTYDPLETWLLPKSDMLCMIRCQEEPPEDAREDGQAAKSMDEENQRKRASSPSRPRTSGQVPGHPAPGATIAAAAQMPKPTGPGHPASSPDIWP